MLEEVRTSVAELASVLAGVAQAEADEVRGIADEIERRIKEKTVRIVVAGDAPSRARILDSILGAKVFEGITPLESASVILRSGDKPDYTARFRDNTRE